MLFRFLLLFSICGITLASYQDSPIVTWISPTEHDLGDLRAHESVTHQFTFKNISGDTLFIDNVRTACGCTAPTWPEGAILPDSLANISVDYDGRDNGYFRRYIKVFFNRQKRAEKLWLSGFVEE